MTTAAKIEMIETLKELETMFKNVKDAKYIIALMYVRQSLQHEVREATLNGYFSTNTYKVKRLDKEKLKADLENDANAVFSEFIRKWIDSEVKKSKNNYGIYGTMYQKGENNEK